MKFTVFNLKRNIVVMIFFCIIITAVFFTACASDTPVITEDMTEEDYFKNAQAASDEGNNKRALAYYFRFKETYPDDLEKNIWASYEIAFLYHKMGDDTKALELFNELLTLYAHDNSGALPRAVKALALTVKERIESKLFPQEEEPK